ncbi:DUF4358 domain-containing protein [Flavonifractor sp. An10]|uniref:DUF4358 domain-containing protein n=1 Tax=Flavonifractor sp. An10 TaxID=1965537 RepID=UPI000B39EAC0|nr:DUF4358 domain-containing protein [Flavonifractor sp. An10]OUQ80486.1 hypothetical protein B5E42_14940 [Flavonifractor sp. An10]
MNKRILSLALAGVLSLGLLTACGAIRARPETDTPQWRAHRHPGDRAHPTPEETVLPETTRRRRRALEEPPTPQCQAFHQALRASSSAPPPAHSHPAPVEPEPTVDVVQSTWNAISQLDIPSLSDVDAETLSALYGINTDDLVSYVCKMPAISVQATEFFIAEVKDGKMDAVKAAVEKRQADLVQQWSQYLPEQLELVENYQLVTSGNYILFAISEYADQAVSAFNSYTN